MMTTEFSSALEMWHCTDALASGRHRVHDDRMQSHTEWFADAIKSSLERLGIDRRLLRTPMLWWSKGFPVKVVRQQWLESLRDSLVPIVFELGEVPANWQEFFPAKPIRDLPDFLDWLNDVSRQQGHDIHSAQCSLGNAHLWMFTHQIESRPEWPQAMPDTVLGCVSAIVRIIDSLSNGSAEPELKVTLEQMSKLLGGKPTVKTMQNRNKINPLPSPVFSSPGMPSSYLYGDLVQWLQSQTWQEPLSIQSELQARTEIPNLA